MENNMGDLDELPSDDDGGNLEITVSDDT